MGFGVEFLGFLCWLWCSLSGFVAARRFGWFVAAGVCAGFWLVVLALLCLGGSDLTGVCVCVGLTQCRFWLRCFRYFLVLIGFGWPCRCFVVWGFLPWFL